MITGLIQGKSPTPSGYSDNTSFGLLISWSLQYKFVWQDSLPPPPGGNRPCKMRGGELTPIGVLFSDFLFKFLVIGSAGTGKSCILHQFIENKCEYQQRCAVGSRRPPNPKNLQQPLFWPQQCSVHSVRDCAVRLPNM